jgi:hypothetical protein
MEVRRRLKKNKIITDIREAELFIDRSENTVKRIKGSGMGEEYVKNQIIKLKIAIKERYECLSVLNKNLKEVVLGELDDVIEEEYNETENRIKSQIIIKNRIKAEKLLKLEEKKEESQKYLKGILHATRSHKQTERDIRYTQKYFEKVVDSLPPYMEKNLLGMPNNKGYIWRGVCFYGKLDEQTGPRIVFENKKGGNLVIHEYNETEYRRYEKDGKNKKQLVYRESRKIKTSGVNLMDYLVKSK